MFFLSMEKPGETYLSFTIHMGIEERENKKTVEFICKVFVQRKI